MGDSLVKRYKEEVAMLKTEKFQQFYVEMLKRCDDSNAEGPASSSGKYHPISSLGVNGLYHHTKTVAILTERMISCIPDFDNPEDHDVMIVAALLHDMCKYAGGSNTTSDHPAAMARIIRAYITECVTDEKDKEYFERVAVAVEAHMSRWNEIKDYTTRPPKIVGHLPTPQSLEEYVICFADMISSMNNLPEILNEMKEVAVQELCRGQFKR